MTAPFARWEDARAQADSAEALRALLGEVARWRAQHLTDMVGQREATWAIAKIHQALGDTEAALREARSLSSLCQTPPPADDAELSAVGDLIAALGGQRPRVRSAGKKRDRNERESRKGARDQPARGEARLTLVQQAIVAGHARDYSEAFKVLRGKGGPTAQLVRSWLDLKQALETPVDQREAALRQLLDRMQGALPDLPAQAAQAAPDTPADAPLEDSRIARLMGRNPPQRRAKSLRAMQAWIDAHPGRADELAAAVLLDHLDSQGTSPAPWYAGFVAQAFLEGGEQTRAALKTLADAGSVAPAIYDEPQFALLLDLWRKAREIGLVFVDLRRGVLRKEPEDRRLWTLRVRRQGVEGVITAARDTDEPLDDALATELAKRVRGLCDNMVLVAPGTGNAALRAGASVLDVRVVEAGDALGTLAELMGRSEGRTAPASDKAGPKSASKMPEKAPANGGAPSHNERVRAVRTALNAEPAPTAEVLAPLVGPIKRVRDVLDLAEQLDGPDASARLRALVLALHRTVPERVRLLQATTLILRRAASGDAGVLDLLTSEESASRLGGEGIGSVIAVALAAQGAGWRLDRVLRGVTRRERRERPALDVLADHLEPLWRVIVQHGDVRGEVWVAEALPPEGRAGLAQLSLRDAPRVGIVGESLAADWESLGGPPMVRVEALPAALESWAGQAR